MVNIAKAAAQQNIVNGKKTDWIVSLDGEELYRLSPGYSVQQTFEVRDIVEKMMKDAFDDGKNLMQAVMKQKLDRIVSHGDAKLDVLKNENERLASILDKFTKE